MGDRESEGDTDEDGISPATPNSFKGEVGECEVPGDRRSSAALAGSSEAVCRCGIG